MSLSISDQIATTRKLTKQVFINDFLNLYNHSLYFEQKKEEILSDILATSSCYDLEEKVVIYCFMRLWEESRVNRYNFLKSFDDNRIYIVQNYIKHYYDKLSKKQESFE